MRNHAIPSNHWTTFLQEVGSPITKIGYRQIDRLNKILSLENEIKAIIDEYNKTDLQLTEDCLKLWTNDELNNARMLEIIQDFDNLDYCPTTDSVTSTNNPTFWLRLNDYKKIANMVEAKFKNIQLTNILKSKLQA